VKLNYADHRQYIGMEVIESTSECYEQKSISSYKRMLPIVKYIA
jgi:hypothetical protein